LDGEPKIRETFLAGRIFAPAVSIYKQQVEIVPTRNSPRAEEVEDEVGAWEGGQEFGKLQEGRGERVGGGGAGCTPEPRRGVVALRDGAEGRGPVSSAARACPGSGATGRASRRCGCRRRDWWR